MMRCGMNMVMLVVLIEVLLAFSSWKKLCCGGQGWVPEAAINDARQPDGRIWCRDMDMVP